MEDFRLRVFRTAAEKLNFTQAASLLHLTQPAITLQIKNLEADLGVRLFDRSGGRLRLTPAGEVLLVYSRRIAGLYEEALRKIGELTRQTRGSLSLGVSTTISQYLLPWVLAGFRQEYPGVRVTVTSGNTEAALRCLAQGSIELAMIEGPPRTAGVKLQKFLDDEIVLIVPRDHRWAIRRQALNPAELLHTPLLMREPGSGTRDVVEEALQAAGLNPSDLQVTMNLDSTEAIKSAVEAGLGVGLVSQWAVRESSRGLLSIVPLANLRIHRTLAFAYPQGPAPDGLPGLFVRYATSVAQGLSDSLQVTKAGARKAKHPVTDSGNLRPETKR